MRQRLPFWPFDTKKVKSLLVNMKVFSHPALTMKQNRGPVITHFVIPTVALMNYNSEVTTAQINNRDLLSKALSQKLLTAIRCWQCGEVHAYVPPWNVSRDVLPLLIDVIFGQMNLR